MGCLRIAITLLVIEIKVPVVESEHSSDLADALLELWPSYLAYAVTFFLVGAYWVNHHRMFFLLRGIDHTFLILNIFCLMAIAIIPFPNAVVAEYLTDPNLRGVAAGVYGIAMLTLAVLFTVTWWYAYRRGLLRPEVDMAKVRKVLRSYAASIVIFSGGIILTNWSPLAALILFMLLPLAYLFEGPVGSIDEGYLGPGD
jgi:uncharacterized membrane protein